MTSLDFNFAEPIASYADSVDESNHTIPEDIGSIKASDFVVLDGRPLKVVEVTHSKPGKHGHAKVDKNFNLFFRCLIYFSFKVHLIGIDIFTGRRYETVQPGDRMVQIPYVTKKDYTIVNIDDDNYITLLDENTCNIRSDMKLKENSDIHRRLLDKFNEDNGQIKATVLKALGEEQIVAFKVID